MLQQGLVGFFDVAVDKVRCFRRVRSQCLAFVQRRWHRAVARISVRQFSAEARAAEHKGAPVLVGGAKPGGDTAFQRYFFHCLRKRRRIVGHATGPPVTHPETFPAALECRQVGAKGHVARVKREARAGGLDRAASQQSALLRAQTEQHPDAGVRVGNHALFDRIHQAAVARCRQPVKLRDQRFLRPLK